MLPFSGSMRSPVPITAMRSVLLLEPAIGPNTRRAPAFGRARASAPIGRKNPMGGRFGPGPRLRSAAEAEASGASQTDHAGIEAGAAPPAVALSVEDTPATRSWASSPRENESES